MNSEFVPNTIALNLDVPIHLKVKAEHCGINQLYAFNFEYNVVSVYQIHDFNNDGTPLAYQIINTYALLEIKGGLAYYEYGWKIFNNEIQERYADYVMENEVLKGKDVKK